MKKILFIIMLSALSCNLEESTYTTSFINNTSSHSITITPYYQGLVVKEDSVNINRNQLYEILSKNNRGKGSGFSYSLYIAIYDSISVKFDNSIQTIHYSDATSHFVSNLNGIKYDSNRSVYNNDNYIRKITHEDKHNISNEYIFTFAEQDYIDAKK
jgi:hypothetical protein